MQPRFHELNISDEPRSSRVEARITQSQKDLFKQAAKLSGLSLSEFVTTSLLKTSNQVIVEHRVLTLSKEQSESFIQAMLNYIEPNEKLRNAFARYKDDFDDENFD